MMSKLKEENKDLEENEIQGAKRRYEKVMIDKKTKSYKTSRFLHSRAKFEHEKRISKAQTKAK